MLDFITGVAGGVVSSVIASKGREYFSLWQKGKGTAKVKQFWNFRSKEIILCMPSYNDMKGEDDKMARIEDVLAYDRLHSYIASFGVTCDLRTETDNVNEHKDLMLICSPIGNSKSEEFELFQRSNFPYQIKKDGWKKGTAALIVRREGGVESSFASPMDENKSAEDYAIVGRYYEKRYNRNVFLFWGIHGVGTFGSVLHMTNEENIKAIYEITHDSNFMLWLKIKFNNFREITENPEWMSVPRIFQ